LDNFAVSLGFRHGASMKNKTLLMIWSSLELPAGIALIAAPSRVAKVLISAGLTPGGEALGRLGGCALFSLAIACWPRGDVDHTQPIRALFLYNLMAACYLGYLKIGGEFSSSFLLLPACALHGLLALLFIRPVYESAVGKGSI
jgi:hypothetical protein